MRTPPALLGLALALLGPALARGDEPPVIVGAGPFEVRAVPDIAYVEGDGADARKHKLDLFLPEGRRDFPVVLFIHGGAWSSGDRKMYGGVGRVFARNGIGAVIVSYRLTPQVKHPGHIEDVAKAFAWTKRHIGEYGGRADQIFVTGQSAGGHLAALLATNPRFLEAETLGLADIKGAMPMSGIYTFPPGRMARIIGEGREAADDASPLKHIGEKLPPFLILYAEDDFPGCDAMSRALDAALRAKHVESDVREIAGRNHISIMFRMMLGEADPTSQELLKFVARHSGLELKPRAEAKTGGGD